MDESNLFRHGVDPDPAAFAGGQSALLVGLWSDVRMAAEEIDAARCERWGSLSREDAGWLW